MFTSDKDNTNSINIAIIIIDYVPLLFFIRNHLLNGRLVVTRIVMILVNRLP